MTSIDDTGTPTPQATSVADASAPAPSAGAHSLRRVWRIIRPRGGRGLFSVLLASLSLGCAIGLIATSAWLISRASQQPPILELGVAVVAVRALGLGRGVFRYVERLVSHNAALRGLTEIRVQLVDRIAVVAPSGMNRLRRGDSLRRFVDDVDTSAEFGLRTVLPGATAIVVGAALVGLVGLLLPAAGLALLAGLLLAGFVAPLVTAGVTRRAAANEVALKGELAAEINAVLAQSAEVIAARATQRSVERVAELDSEICAAEQTSARGLGLAAAIGAAGQGFALLAIILAAVPAVNTGQLNGVNLAVVVLIPLVAFELVITLPAAAVWLSKSRASSTRIVEILDTRNAVPDPVEPVTISSSAASSPELRVDGVCVTWPGALQPAVANVSLQLGPGKRIAIVGPSGIGKSSLAAGLAKLAPMTGSAALCGVNYADLTGEQVREIVGYSEQHAHIFDNTIAENIRLANRAASDEEILDALERVRLGEWVATLPDGIATAVGERGAQLSGGQRQRLSLARMIVANRPIAIFDEPTEHLDAATAEQLAADILTVMDGRSVIYITHLPYGLDLVDEVIDLSDLGTPTGYGAPEETGESGYASDITVVGS